MVRLTVKPVEPLKQKQRQQVNSINKWAKKWAAFNFYYVFAQIWVTSMFDVLSYIACDCIWLPANCFLTKLLFFNFQVLGLARLYYSSGLSHKVLIFFLELYLGQKISHRQPSSISHPFSFSVFCHRVGRFFNNNMIFWDSSASLWG